MRSVDESACEQGLGGGLWSLCLGVGNLGARRVCNVLGFQGSSNGLRISIGFVYFSRVRCWRAHTQGIPYVAPSCCQP